ncbi:hypothetical protein [Streptomyces sp. V3I7]|uniref:hypothetical protein n=1 Tax=Streptomyces sp. V3I7 TaxID=3042278 RepID=UPI00277D898C|nr:hypothetical protein [Streptomyces sp. V3I7]MDQ0992179.1 hypothetical protein [Streptomyces sp. V3I7]
MQTRTVIAAATAALAVALAGCSGTDTDNARPKAKTTKSSKASPDWKAAEKAADIPPEPTGAKRAELLRALAAANPSTVRYEDKAIDAARNQCSAINNGGQRIDYLASQRFTYKDVTTTETQGKQINKALKDSGFCKA